jgi:dimethylamine/trimethylamine dehydrogenase
MGGVIAELLADKGYETHYLTPASEASTWTRATLEQHFIQTRMLLKGIHIQTFRTLQSIERDHVMASCVFTGALIDIPADSVVLVTARSPQEKLASELQARRSEWGHAGLQSVSVIGDAQAPATIAHATYAGRRFAEELDGPSINGDQLPFRREITQLLP